LTEREDTDDIAKMKKLHAVAIDSLESYRKSQEDQDPSSGNGKDGVGGKVVRYLRMRSGLY